MATRERQKAATRNARPHKGVEAQARLKWLRMSPRKVRLVVDQVRNRKVGEALHMLAASPKAAAKPVRKLLWSAVSNLEQDRERVDVENLRVVRAYVDEGATWRRWLPRAMGRATRVRKHTSHVTIVVG